MEIKVIATGSEGNCCWVRTGSSTFLLEAGIPFKQIQKAVNFKTSEIDFCLCSHSHQDHSKAIKDVIKAGIDCYASQETINSLELPVNHRSHVIEAKKQFKVGELTVLPFDCVHDVMNLGFLIVTPNNERILYATDSMYVKYKFNNLTYILLEVNYSSSILNENVESGIVALELRNRIMRSHMSLETAKDFFRANDLSRLKEVHLLHSSKQNSNTEQFKREIMGIVGVPVYVY